MEHQLLTSGQIAKLLNMPFTQIMYLLQSRQIAPVTRIGPIRLFGPEAIDQIRNARKQIARRRRVAV